MKRLVLSLCFIVLAGCAAPQTTSDEKWVRFSIEGGSFGDPRGVNYFVVLDDGTYDVSTQKKLYGYASYVLNYRGLVEAMYEEDAEYIVVVSFKEYNKIDDQQVFQLAAGSKRIYESLGELRPSWVAASIHNGDPISQENMLALHTLAIREFAGGNPYPAGVPRSFERNSTVVDSVKREVASYIRSAEVLDAEQ